MTSQNVTQIAPGIATATSGLATYLDLLEQGLGIVASTLGIIWTSIVMYKAAREWWKERQAKKGDKDAVD